MADTIESLIRGIIASKTVLVGKALSCGLFTTNESQTAKLSEAVSRFNDMPVHDCKNFDIKVGETRSIDPGYHKGCTITGVGHDGVTKNYALQYDIVVDSPEPDATASKMVTLAKNGDPNNYYGMGSVFVKPLGPQYINTEDATISIAKDSEGKDVSSHVLSGEIAYGKDANGNAKKLIGSMPNKTGWSASINKGDQNYRVKIEKGYHDGSKYVSVVAKTLEVECPTNHDMSTTYPKSGDTDKSFYDKVVIGPLPTRFADISGASHDATSATSASGLVAGNVLTGTTVFALDIPNGKAKRISGTMPSNGAGGGEIDGINTTDFYLPYGYYNGEGTVKFNPTTIIQLLQGI